MSDFIALDRSEARKIRDDLLNAPLAPRTLSHCLNVGTEPVLDILEQQYFQIRLPEGSGAFKYVQGYYGVGKTQFIYSLAARAWRNDLATAIVDIGTECPFNSPLALYKAVMRSFVVPERGHDPNEQQRGIEFLILRWVEAKLREAGVAPGRESEPDKWEQIDSLLSQTPLGYPDVQAMICVQRLAKSLLAHAIKPGGQVDSQALEWLRGERVRFPELQRVGLTEPVTDANAFNRLKTVLQFLRRVLGYKGFMIAFDEGTRTGSFRHGSAREKQAVENMLTMINDATGGAFGGVLFIYAATPEFRSNVVNRYQALDARIGSTVFAPGSPMVALIDLDLINSDELIEKIGRRLREIFATASDVSWDESLQTLNMHRLFAALKEQQFGQSVIPRTFVYHYCLLLKQQEVAQSELSEAEATALSEGQPPEVTE
jgi:hypothetical protein